MTSTRMTPQELAELDLAVARVEGIDIHHGFIDDGWTGPDHNGKRHRAFKMYQPTRDAQEAGRLLVKYNLSLIAPIPGNKYWYANWGLAQETAGETPWIAACNAVVALGGRK